MEASILNAVSGPEIIALLALAATNILLSILVAIYKGEFSFVEVGKFVGTRAVPLIAYLVVAALADIVDGYAAVAIVLYAGLVALYGTGILRAIRSLFPWLKLPENLTEKEKVK